MCYDILRVKAQMQRERLYEHAVLKREVRLAFLCTRTGTCETWCIEPHGIGVWLGGIELATTRARMQPRLLAYQETMTEATESQLRSGDVSSVNNGARFMLALDDHIGRLDERISRDYDTTSGDI
jgi:hypothetical protein